MIVTVKGRKDPITGIESIIVGDDGYLSFLQSFKTPMCYHFSDIVKIDEEEKD